MSTTAIIVVAVVGGVLLLGALALVARARSARCVEQRRGEANSLRATAQDAERRAERERAAADREAARSRRAQAEADEKAALARTQALNAQERLGQADRAAGIAEERQARADEIDPDVEADGAAVRSDRSGDGQEPQAEAPARSA